MLAPFSASLDAFEAYKGTAGQQRQEKIVANNGVYRNLEEIMFDGKHIFRKDAAARKQFTYSVVLAKVTTNRRTGFTVKVNAPEEGKTVANAQLRLDGEPKPFYANERGIISAKVPEGTYKGVITAPGFAPMAVTFLSGKGVTHREEVTLSVAIANAG